MGLLNDLACRRGKAGDELHDGGNLVLRVGATRRTWTLVWRDGGRVRKVRLAEYPSTGLGAARTLAADGMARVRQGLSPVPPPAAAAPRMPPPRALSGPTVGTILRTYVSRHVRHAARSPGQIEAVIDRQLAVLHHIPVADLDRQGIVRFLDRVTDERGASSARKAGTTLHAALRHAVRRGDIPGDPMSLIKLPSDGPSRDRVLTDLEIAALWTSQVPIWSRLARTLLLTALRLREAAAAPAAEIVGDVWEISAARMKEGKAHAVPVTPLLRAELGDLNGTWLFRSPFRMNQPVAGFTKGVRALHAATGTVGWSFHDLRRTCASGLQRLGCPHEVIESILAHRLGGVSGTYQRHQYLEERRAWLTRWADWCSRRRGDTTPGPEL